MIPGGVESEDEYSVSKELLFAYLASREALDACDGQEYVIKQYSAFLKNYVRVLHHRRAFASSHSVLVVLHRHRIVPSCCVVLFYRRILTTF
jgi:hypothetical protein